MSEKMEDWIKKQNKRIEKSAEIFLSGLERDLKDFKNGYRIIKLSKINNGGQDIDEKYLNYFTNKFSEKYECNCLSVSKDSSTFSPGEYIFLFKK